MQSESRDPPDIFYRLRGTRWQSHDGCTLTTARHASGGRSRSRARHKLRVTENSRGSLRESEKSFESPAEAKRNSEKLIAKKIRQGYREVDPARLEIVRDKGRRRATDHQIKALERQIGTKLPKGYRDFLKTVNGGRPNPRFINVPGAAGIDNVGVGQLFHLQPAKEHYSEADLSDSGHGTFAARWTLANRGR